MPPIDEGLEFLSEWIGSQHVRIANELELRAIVMKEEWKKQMSDRMIAKIRGEVSDSQRPIGCAVVEMWPDLCVKRFGMLPAPLAMLGQDRLRIVAGMRMEGQQEVAPCRREMGVHFDSLAESEQSGVNVPLISENAAQVVMGLGQVGLEMEGTVARIERLIEPPLVLRATPRLL